MLSHSKRPVVIWLFTGALLTWAMVVIGGITRLTGSGLSITEWKVIMGVLPPLNESQWLETFEKYKQTPQYVLENSHFNLAQFKQIFWWEFIHRFIGRLIGIVFIVPFIYFHIRKEIDKTLNKKLLLIFGLGALQGFLGWFMVKSGLVKDPAVSHYRLALHLVNAFACCGYILWVALELIKNRTDGLSGERKKIFSYTRYLFALVILQIIYGAFVAGMDAGLIYNTWPKMNDEWIASNTFALDPWWINLMEHKDGVQFIHRCLAYIVAISAVYIWLRARKNNLNISQNNAAHLMLAAVFVQVLLGIFTLLYHVPIALGVLHQTGAFLLFCSVIYFLHQLKVE